jgi:hypothetical protein
MKNGSLAEMQGFLLCKAFELNAVDHGIKRVENVFFIVFREFSNIIQPFEH